MTNKRQLKKYIHNVCGDLASEILIACQLFDGYDEVAVEKVIIDIFKKDYKDAIDNIKAIIKTEYGTII